MLKYQPLRKRNSIDWQKESEFWSFKPITKYPLPQVNSQLPVRNEIDNFVFQRLADQQLLPAGQADRRTLIRRLSFNLVGLPPTPEEINSNSLPTRTRRLTPNW